MKKLFYIVCILLLIILMSCATGQGIRISPPPKKYSRIIEAAIETAIVSAIEKAVITVKQNPKEMNKFYLIDENGKIIIRANLSDLLIIEKYDITETANFAVIYDIYNSEKNGLEGFIVPFTVESLESGETRQDILLWKPEEDDSGILLSFDDAFLEKWEENFDLFDEYNAKVTFFIQGDFSSFCITALERGHDIGYHSLNHLNLPKVSRNVFYEETLSKVGNFRNAGVPLTSFAYPYGLSETWMNDELLKSFDRLRGYGVTFRLYDQKTIGKGYSSSKAIDNILFKEDEAFMKNMDIMLRTIKFLNSSSVLPLTTHDISDSADWGIKPERLRYLLKTCNDLRLNFYRYKDLH